MESVRTLTATSSRESKPIKTFMGSDGFIDS
jgi:hypothetical protein